MKEIIGLRDLGSGALYKLKDFPPTMIVIGCARGCDLILRGEGIQERHAVLTREGAKQPWIFSCISGAPAIINGVPTRESVELQPGYFIKLANIELITLADCKMKVPASSPSSLIRLLYRIRGSYRDAAKWIGCSHTHVSRVVNGKRGKNRSDKK